MFASETEKDDVNEDRGGIVSVDATITSVVGRLDRVVVIVIAVALN